VFSYLGNPGVGSLHCIRRAVEKSIPRSLDIEEYSHFGMVGRYIAGASNLPFFPLRSYLGSDLVQVNPQIQFVESPYGDGQIAVVPPIKPDVAFLHAQRADVSGNTQIWGLLGMQKEVAFASRKVVVIVEKIVDETVIRNDPNRTLIPGLVVDAVVHEPYGAHPSYVQGYYDRDNDFYLAWDKISRNQESTEAWLREWVYGVTDRTAYLEKLGQEQLEKLDPGKLWAEPINYGRYD
jgi:glutaconate CoA-transferase subunit A